MIKIISFDNLIFILFSGNYITQRCVSDATPKTVKKDRVERLVQLGSAR